MKLLILSPDAFSVFYTDTDYIFGGIEMETGHHAIGLSELGVEVHVLTRDQGRPESQTGKIHIHPLGELKGKGYWEKRNSFFGKVSFKMFGDRNQKTIEDWCNEIQPDCYYVMGISREALRFARAAKKHRKKFVFRAAHDRDLGGDQFSEAGFQTWAKMTMSEVREVIDCADVLIAQTPYQSELFKQRFQRDSKCMFPPIVIETAKQEKNEYDALWIGRTNSFKRPEQLVALAANLPDRKFCMVLNRASTEEWDRIAQTIPDNVTLIESIPSDRIEDYFRRSRLYISTSLHEGFPNTFLQAAKNGIPILSMGSDPNAMLTTHGAGELVGDSMENLTLAMKRLLQDEELYRRTAIAGPAYVAQYNDRKVISKQLLEIIQTQVGATR